jgi:hypothetical protein
MGVEVKPVISLEFQTPRFARISKPATGWDQWAFSPPYAYIELDIDDARHLWNELGRKIREFNKEQEA